jgi:hypothetical protein
MQHVLIVGLEHTLQGVRDKAKLCTKHEMRLYMKRRCQCCEGRGADPDLGLCRVFGETVALLRHWREASHKIRAKVRLIIWVLRFAQEHPVGRVLLCAARMSGARAREAFDHGLQHVSKPDG